MTANEAVAEVIAVRVGMTTRPRSAIYHRYADFDEPDLDQQLDYFFWIVRTGESTIVVDSGFEPAAGERRGVTTLVTVRDALARLGFRGEDVETVIVTHFHYDHIGNLDAFPNAEVIVGAREYEFYTSPLAQRLHFRKHVEAAEIDHVAAAHREGRVRLVEGSEEVRPGITTITTGGHAPGQQIVVVARPDGDVVLASDAAHLYEELERDWPFAIFVDLPKMYETLEALRDFERNGAVVLPGHDPAVPSRFPALVGEAADIAFRIS